MRERAEVSLTGPSQLDTDCSAILLELCYLVSGLPDPTAPTCASLLRVVISRISPNKPSSSRLGYAPEPNTHVLVLKCLFVLPLEIWEGRLEEAEMAVIMGGLHSPDDTIRRSVGGHSGAAFRFTDTSDTESAVPPFTGPPFCDLR